MDSMVCLTQASESIFDARLLPVLSSARPFRFCFPFFYGIRRVMSILWEESLVVV
jgi:hypothetical protein